MRKKLKPVANEDKTLFLFPYFGTEISAGRCARVYIMRLVLACLVSVSCTLTVGFSLGVELGFQLSGFTIALCLVFGALNIVSKTSPLIIMILAAATCYFMRAELLAVLEEAGEAFLSVADDMTNYSDCTAFVYILSGLFAFFCSFYVISSLPMPVLAAMLATILLIPAIIGGSLSVSAPLVLMMASTWACIQFSLCYGVERSFVGETRYALAKDKKLRFFNGSRLLKNNASVHGRFSSEAFVTLVCVLLIFSIISSCVPQSAKLDYKSVIDAITEFSESVSDFFGFGAKDQFNGFFTADGSDEMKISNDITVSPGSSEKQVLNVTLSRPDQKVYLRGDIGYEFTGKGWRSISEIDYASLIYDDWRFDELFKSYATDLDYQLFRQRVFSLGYDAEQFISGITLKVEYLCDTNTLFTPVSPIDASFRDNEAFNVLGDYVANTSGKRRIGSYQTAALIPMLSSYTEYHLASLAQTYYNESDDSTLYYPNAMSYYEYQEAQEAYRVFISNYYLGVPEEEKENIRKFIHDVVEKHFYPVDSVYEIFPMISVEDASFFAEVFIDKFHNSFRYSLTADNESGDNTMLGNFLFDTKSGHCALYATALTLILREQGIPARYVTGFVVGGAGDKFEKAADGYVFPVYESNLHAWTEVYFEGVGWLPFDATPHSVVYTDSPIATATSASETKPPEDTSETTERTTEATTTKSSDTETTTKNTDSSLTTPDGTDKPQDNSQSLRILLVIGIIILSLAVIAIAVTSLTALKKRLRLNEKKLFSRLISDSNTQASVRKLLRITLRLLSLERVKKSVGETPVQFAQRIDELYPNESGVDCVEAMVVFEKAEFSKADNLVITDDERKIAFDFTKALSKIVVHDVKNPVVRFIRSYVMFRKIK